MTEKLAIDGGKPVREKSLPGEYPGGMLYGKEELNAVIDVMKRKSPFRYYGPDMAWKAKAFEKAFAAKMGTKHCLGVTSGTSSLVVALKALGIGSGDKVILPASTFIATAGAVIVAGAVPVFAEIDESLNINPDAIEGMIDKDTRCIIPVHLLGNPCKMDRIMKIAKKHKLHVIEDCAQSCGCKYQGKYVGSLSDIGCFSLQMNKMITAGEGGAVITDNPKHYEMAARYHDHGMFRESEGFLGMKEADSVIVGENYRMSELTGAIALEQLKKLDRIISAMRKIKKLIKDEIKDVRGLAFRKINDPDGDTGNVLCMIFPSAEINLRFRKALGGEHINAAVSYGGEAVYMMPQILHQRTADRNGFPFNQFKKKVTYKKGMCPFTEDLLKRHCYIHITSRFTEKDAEDVVTGIKKVAEHIL